MFRSGFCLFRNILPDEEKVEVAHRRRMNGRDGEGRGTGTVSYTHLTLPTN